MAFIQYLVFDGMPLPLPDSYEVSMEDVEVDCGGETEAGTMQRDEVRLGVVSFSVSPKWLKLLEASEYTAGMQILAVQKETVRPETEVMEENIDKTRKGSGSITYEKNVEHLFSDSLQAEASEGGARFR